MNYGFNRDQFHQDLQDFWKFFSGFGKSFGPTAKKAKGQEIGFFHESYIRFRLNLVEMGISKVIRVVISLIVAMILYVVLFRNSDLTMRFILVFGFVVFYAWLMMEHLVVDKKPVDATAKLIVSVHDFWKSLYEGIKGFFSGVVAGLTPSGDSKK